MIPWPNVCIWFLFFFEAAVVVQDQLHTELKGFPWWQAQHLQLTIPQQAQHLEHVIVKFLAKRSTWNMFYLIQLAHTHSLLQVATNKPRCSYSRNPHKGKQKNRDYAINKNWTKRFTVMFVCHRKQKQEHQILNLQVTSQNCKQKFGRMRSRWFFLSQIEWGLCWCHPQTARDGHTKEFSRE